MSLKTQKKTLQSWEPLYEVCQILAEQEQLKVTVSGALQGALISAAGAFVGGLLGGPRGLAMGAAISAVTVAALTEGSYRSVVDILRTDLTREQKRKLASSLERLVDASSGDVATILSLIGARSSLKSAIIKEIGNFLSSELNLSMIGN